MQIKILYEDQDILAIDKPSGISVHPSAMLRAGPAEETVLEILEKKYPGLQLAHRLDKDTSGVLVLVKNENAYEFMKKQFQGRAVKKIYHAIVDGEIKKDRGVIDKPIGRTRSDPRKRHAGRGVTGKEREAVTEYKVLKRFTDKAGNKFTYLEISPKTGRTHQIRVHMKFLNHPIACDPLYNPKGACPAGLSRMALHAKSIEFKTPDAKQIRVESRVPEEIAKIVK